MWMGRLAQQPVASCARMRLWQRSAVPAAALALLLVLASIPPARADGPDLVERALRATVFLEGDGVYGAGILVDPTRGLILTSHHVVSEMSVPHATPYRGRPTHARVIASDAKLDLAVLEAPGLRFRGPPPLLADTQGLRPGEEVFAIGAPRRLAFTVSRGIVSYVDREMEGARYVQLDMSINDGNSGGPVVTERGEIVAVMSFVLERAQGLSFALPMRYAWRAFPGLVPLPRCAPKGPPPDEKGRPITQAPPGRPSRDHGARPFPQRVGDKPQGDEPSSAALCRSVHLSFPPRWPRRLSASRRSLSTSAPGTTGLPITSSTPRR